MINKKIFLITTVLLFLGANLIAENTVHDLIKEVCPEAEIIWEKEFKGKLLNYDVAKKSGDVAFTLWIDTGRKKVDHVKHYKGFDYEMVVQSKDGEGIFDNKSFGFGSSVKLTGIMLPKIRTVA